MAASIFNPLVGINAEPPNDPFYRGGTKKVPPPIASPMPANSSLIIDDAKSAGKNEQHRGKAALEKAKSADKSMQPAKESGAGKLTPEIESQKTPSPSAAPPRGGATPADGPLARFSAQHGRNIALSGPQETKMGRAGLKFTEGPYKGLTSAQAYEKFASENRGAMKVPSPSPMAGPGSRAGQASGNVNAPRFDADGNPIAPAGGYSRYGQPIDITHDSQGNPVNPYRYHADTVGTDGFDEGDRQEREAAYRFDEAQRNAAVVADARRAVAERKQQMQAEKERQNMKIAETGTYTTPDGVTTFYDQADRQRAQESVDLANQARIVAREEGGMDEARKLAAKSTDLSRAGARSSQGRGTYMENEYGYGYAGTPLIQVNRENVMPIDAAKDALKGKMTPEQQAAARSIPTAMGGAAGMQKMIQDDARSAIDYAVQDTLMDQYGGGRIQQQNAALEEFRPPLQIPEEPAYRTTRTTTMEVPTKKRKPGDDGMGGQIPFRNT